MNRTLIYGMLLFGGLAWIARTAKRYYDKLQVRFSGFTIDELILTGNTAATFTLDIYNPTPVALTINSLVGDIYINNHFIGTLQNYTAQTIDSYRASRITASISVPTMNLAAKLIQILQDKSSSYSLRYRGNMVVGGINLKLDFTTKL